MTNLTQRGLESASRRRFAGVTRLYGDAAHQHFARAHIGVAGVGGVGTWAVEALARSGIGALTLFDLDMIAESNTNRQIHALGDAYGRAKVDAMAERVRAINPDCRVSVIEDFITPENVSELVPPATFDYFVDAIDDTRAKVALAAWCVAQEIPLVMAGAAGGRRDPTRIRVDDLARTRHDALLARVRQQLRKHHRFARDPKQKFGISAVFSEEPQPAAVAPTPACAPGSALSCTGYGSAVAVTGSFGFTAAAVVLDRLSQPHPGHHS